MDTKLQVTMERLETPIGEMVVTTDAEGTLRAVDWTDHGERMLKMLRRYYGKDGFTLVEGKVPDKVRNAVQRYFGGELEALDGLPVAETGTAFQREVWRALREIPCGTTVSYGELAKRIGRPAAVRAVGLANGSNPVGVIVPCHRVIGSDGSLTGYGGGMERKQWLLLHEKATSRVKGSARLFE